MKYSITVEVFKDYVQESEEILLCTDDGTRALNAFIDFLMSLRDEMQEYEACDKNTLHHQTWWFYNYMGQKDTFLQVTFRAEY